MELLRTLLTSAIMGSPFLALVAAVAIFINDRQKYRGKGRSIILFSIGALLIGIIGGVIGMVVGNFAYCPFYEGEQCGFFLAVFIGPPSFSIATAFYLYYWVRLGKKLTSRSGEMV
jgi:hypothetical protein